MLFMQRCRWQRQNAAYRQAASAFFAAAVLHKTDAGEQTEIYAEVATRA